MFHRSSEAFNREFRVSLEAEAILKIRAEIIRLQALSESNRELLTGLNLSRPGLRKNVHQFWERTGDCFVLSETEDMRKKVQAEQKDINQKISALRAQRKTHTANLLQLRPETTTMSPESIKLLLQDEQDTDSSDSD